jgi:hypothetical protein
VDEKGKTYTDVCMVFADSFADNPDEADANARAIAALPMLLAACQMHELYERWYESNLSSPKESENLRELTELLIAHGYVVGGDKHRCDFITDFRRDVIAAATGQEVAS